MTEQVNETAKITWTKKPTEPGWYWMKLLGVEEDPCTWNLRVVKVVPATIKWVNIPVGEEECLYIDWEGGPTINLDVYLTYRVLWAGPLSPPLWREEELKQRGKEESND